MDAQWRYHIISNKLYSIVSLFLYKMHKIQFTCTPSVEIFANLHPLGQIITRKHHIAGLLCGRKLSPVACRFVVAQFATPTNVAPECVLMENEISMRHSASHLVTQCSPCFEAACFSICTFPFGVKWSYAPCLEVSIRFIPPAHTVYDLFHPYW